MADRTEIAWCDSTFNPWIGCTKVGPGCDHCYAEADFDLRRHRAKWGPGNPRSRTSPANWKKPLQWNEQRFFQCIKCGWRGPLPGVKHEPNRLVFYSHSCGGDLIDTRRRVFCASLADVFDNEVPEQWRRDVFDLIRTTPNLDWLLLTKRIGNAQRLFDDAHMDPPDGGSGYEWPSNVWLGATICNKEEADRDISKLLAVPAAVRWLSMEPLLGPVDLPVNLIYSDILPEGGVRERKAIEWVVVGGESGTNARPMHPAWARSLRDQCAVAGVPFLFKQWGEWRPATAGELCDGAEFVRVGKKSAGRLLDGVQHDGYPACEHFKEKAK